MTPGSQPFESEPPSAGLAFQAPVPETPESLSESPEVSLAVSFLRAANQPIAQALHLRWSALRATAWHGPGRSQGRAGLAAGRDRARTPHCAARSVGLGPGPGCGGSYPARSRDRRQTGDRPRAAGGRDDGDRTRSGGVARDPAYLLLAPRFQHPANRSGASALSAGVGAGVARWPVTSCDHWGGTSPRYWESGLPGQPTAWSRRGCITCHAVRRSGGVPSAIGSSPGNRCRW